MPAGCGSPLRRAMGEEEGRSRGAGNPAKVWTYASGDRCALEHRKNVRRSGAQESCSLNDEGSGFASEAFVLDIAFIARD